MSFGFSVGDFIAVAKLIKDISDSLQEVGGSKTEYQELLRELESAQQALSHLDRLQPNGLSSATLDSIKFTALSCRRPLQEFLKKIKKYDKSLGVWSKRISLQSVADKVQWAFRHKNEVQRLQGYLSVHIGIINILLAEHGIEMMSIASEKAETDNLHVRERLEGTRNIIACIKESVSAQALAIKTTNSMLLRLFEMISGEFNASLKSLREMITKACVSTQQIYAIVLEIKGSLAIVDTRWTFFQAPLLIEDALGFKFPVPSEYDYDLLHKIIQHRFSDGPGSADVEVGNYELFNAKNSKQVITSSVRLLPGTNITMAILLGKPHLTDEKCPMPRCQSSQTRVSPGGGRVCCECNVWFDQSTKKRKRLQDVVDVIDQQDESSYDKRKMDQGEPPRKRAKTSNEDNVVSFRNVRWSIQEVCLDDADFEAKFNRRGPIPNDASSYPDSIKARHSDELETYNLFLDIATEHNDLCLGITELIRDMKHLERVYNFFDRLAAKSKVPYGCL